MGAHSSKRRTKELLSYTKTSRKDKVWLLYIKYTRGNRARLSINILREVCAFLPHHSDQAHVTQSFIKFYNFQREKTLILKVSMFP